jgi:hypothetical protein
MRESPKGGETGSRGRKARGMRVTNGPIAAAAAAACCLLGCRTVTPLPPSSAFSWSFRSDRPASPPSSSSFRAPLFRTAASAAAAQGTGRRTGGAPPPPPLLLLRGSGDGDGGGDGGEREKEDRSDSRNGKRNPSDGEEEATEEDAFPGDSLKGDGGDGTPFVIKKKTGKKQNGRRGREYRVLDDRDVLPFQIKLQTPDPYTHPDVKRRRAAENGPPSKKAPPAAGGGGKEKKLDPLQEHMIRSTLYRANSSGAGSGSGVGGKNNNKKKKQQQRGASEEATKTLLGEFALDKHTTTGDSLQIGDVQYRVVRHRCQYKYAGGQQFVMVRKILEVKEVGRALTEEYLQRQWNHSP